MMKDRADALTPDRLDPEQHKLYEQIVGGPRGTGPFTVIEEDGSLTGPFGLMLVAPAVGSALSALGEAIRYRSGLGGRLREIAILTVASYRRDPFEWYAHERVARSMGMGDAELEALRTGNNAFWTDRAERAVHRAVRDIVGRRSLDDAVYADVQEALGPEGVVELVTLVGYYDTLSLLMTVFGVGVPTGEPDPFA